MLEVLSWNAIAELLAGAGAFLAGVAQVARIVLDLCRKRVRKQPMIR